jgi:hypothetical protein
MTHQGPRIIAEVGQRMAELVRQVLLGSNLNLQHKMMQWLNLSTAHGSTGGINAPAHYCRDALTLWKKMAALGQWETDWRGSVRMSPFAERMPKAIFRHLTTGR